MMNKRIISFLMALVLMFGIFGTALPVSAEETAQTAAREDANQGGLLSWLFSFGRNDAQSLSAVSENAVASGWSGSTQWTLSADGVLTVYGSGNMKNYDYGGGQPWLGKGVDITSVVIEEGVTSVGSGAFRNLTTLKSVTFPETTLTKMGEAAFYGSGLESVEIPASLWTIQPYTFKNCANLKSVTFHEGNLQKISDGAFYGTGLTNLVLPDCLEILDTFAFKGCENLTSITIGSGMTELREAVFYGTAISTIVIPEGITKIGPYVFKNCTSLKTAILPESVQSVGEASFYACTALKAMNFPDAVASIGNYAFRKCTALTDVNFGANMTAIGESSFYGCDHLTGLEIPDNVTLIGPYAFKGCIRVTSVKLPQSLTVLGESAFHTCTALSRITIPAAVEQIGGYCFSGCTNLKEIVFLGDMPSIGGGAFNKVTATVSYPADNDTWSEDNTFGGDITWSESTAGEEDTTPVIYVTDAAASAGGEVQVIISVKNNPGILGMRLTVSYDESALSLTGAVKGDAMNPLTMTLPGVLENGCGFAFDAMELNEEDILDGQVLILTFQVSNSASGSYQIELGCTGVYDNNVQPLDISLSNGNVTVAG